MKRGTTFRMVLTAMFASMICVATMCVQIKSSMGGYVNLGDALVLLGAFLLGAHGGAIAAGLGSALADLLSGYAHYAPGTLIIKALCALAAAALYRRLSKKSGMPRALSCVLSGLAGEAIMVVGYLFYAWVCLGRGAAAVASVPGNLAQAAAGIVIAAVLTPLTLRSDEIREFLEKYRKP